MSNDIRGFAIQLESWTTEYKAHREEQPDMFTGRKSLSVTVSPPENKHLKPRDAESPKRRPQSFTDGRRLTLRFQNLKGFLVDFVEKPEPDSFLSVPRFEVAF